MLIFCLPVFIPDHLSSLILFLFPGIILPDGVYNWVKNW
jgi:hypothetical protein